jgi:hypothetical protein
MDAYTKYELDSLLELITNHGTLQQMLTFAVMVESLPREHLRTYTQSWQGTREGIVLQDILLSSHYMEKNVNKTIDTKVPDGWYREMYKKR